MNSVAVVPVYNHGDTVGAVVDALRTHGLAVILVDDGSDTATARKLDALAAGMRGAEPPLRLTRHPKNRGKGAAMMMGFRLASETGASHVLQVDADAQHDLDVVPRFLEAARQHPGAVIAGYPRYDRSVPKGRLIARYLTHVWVWINTLSLRVVDSMCGFRLYPLAATLPLLPALHRAARMDFDTEILVRLDWEGVPIVNLPVAVHYPADGVSHFRVWRDNVRISAMHARLFLGMLWRAPRLLARHFYRSA